MKITPVAQGSGVPADTSTGQTADPGKLARAKAIAAGQEIPQSGDQQVDRTRASLKKIKMRTQVSQNRHEFQEVPQDTVDAVLDAAPNTVNTVEIPTPDVVEPTQAEETKPLSPQFAALARQKRALQVKEREIAQREEALETQPGPNMDEYVSKADLLAKPLEVLLGNGVTYDRLTEDILNQQSAPIDPQKLRAEIKEDLKKELLGEFGTRDQQAEAQVLADIKRDAIQITSQGEEFEAIREARAQNTVVDLIHRTWKQTGEILDTVEAAQLVENQLIEEALPFAKLKKIQGRLTPAQEVQVAQTPTPQKPGTKIMRTLTNRDNASPIMDRRTRAIAAMENRLKKG